MVSNKEVIMELAKVLDPEIGADIVTIGLIYNINQMPENGVRVTLTMTSPMCPVMSIILADVQLRLEAIPKIGKVDIELVWDPLWNPEMMGDELKYGRM